ncbi:MAG TPA: PTS sugar transporter subunit IIA [Rhabdochlamydiaceae bacterium]|nr:PTS sugar transporter subunit IIA [Rhabdochlamydiaceae bacterium]
MDLKIKDVADLLNVSETTIRRWLSNGKIPAYRINHQYRFSRIEIENWMISCKHKPSEEFFSPFAEEQIYPVPEESKEPQSQRSGLQQFCLYRAIHQGEAFFSIAGKTKEEVIRGTTRLIAPKLGVDSEVLAELLLDREKLMPTALNNGIAVPHTRDLVKQGPFDRIFVVFPEEPLEYGALDGESVYALFFLFACSDKRHLQLLAKLAHLGSSAEALSFLRSKPNKKKLLEYLRSWEVKIRQPSDGS